VNRTPNTQGSGTPGRLARFIRDVAIVAGFVGTGASLLQFLVDGPPGVWWLLLFVGAGILAVGTGLIPDGPRTGSQSAGLMAWGGVIVAVALLGAFGMIHPPDQPGTDDGDGTPTPTPSVTQTTATPSVTETTTQPPSGRAVDLSAARDGRTVTLTTTVRRPPESGRNYFVVIVLKRSQTGATEVYAQKQLSATPGVPESVSVELADVFEKRTALVVSAVPEVAEAFQFQLNSPRGNTEPLLSIPCTGCDASDVVAITP
jgi:hypothetical protein